MSSYSNWQPNFKERYGSWVNPLPSEMTLADFAPFVSREMRPGRTYNFPIVVQEEHGQTRNADHSAFGLNPAVDSVVKEASLSGAEILIRGQIPYGVRAKGMNGAGNGNTGGAFWESMDLKVEHLMIAGEREREIDLAYGCGTGSTLAANIGVINNASVSGSITAGLVVNLTRASWIPGLWIHMVGAKVDIYQSDLSTLRESDVSVSAPDATNCRITLTKSGSAATIASGDVIVPASARTKSAYGIQAMLENTGTIHGISAASYPMWKSVSYSAGSGTMTRQKIGRLAAQLFPNGLTNGGKLFVSGPTFADLAEEADALQRFTGNGRDVARQGENRLEYKSPIGLITVELYKYMKQGIAFFLANDNVKRVGETDLTFSLDGSDRWFFKELENNAGSEIRIYSSQAPCLEIPYHCGIVTDLVNGGDATPG
jgi:hypothetical protein